MPTRQAICGNGKPSSGRRRLRRRRARGVVRLRLRLGLLLRLRVRLSGLLGLLVRSLEELRCCPSAGGRRISGSCSTAAAAGRVHDQSSFYADAIADCLEFIKSRSS
uniref:Uncharacterized protein n=1 Tax=Leersia perrieri TaxID=77586 RepID=A0A0D9WS93_9ORYZ